MITREIKIGDVALGGANPVRVQGMLKSSFDEPQKLLEEAREMVANGAEIIRVALPSIENVEAVYKALEPLNVPLVADCHFQSRIALKAIETGFKKIRLNPGNMSREGMKEAIELAKKHDLAIRFGFNRPALFLGFVLGTLFERYFFIALRLEGALFFVRPISLALIAITIAVIAYDPVKGLIKRKRGVRKT